MITDALTRKLKTLIASKWDPHCPVHDDELITSSLALAGGADTTLIEDLDVSPFRLVWVWAELTFSAGADANSDIVVDGAAPATRNNYDSEYAKVSLAYNTTIPYKRRGNLLVDVDALQFIRIRGVNNSAAQAATISKVAIRKVI